MVKSGDDTGLGILDLCCLLGFAVAAVKKLGNSRIPRLLRSLCSLVMT